MTQWKTIDSAPKDRTKIDLWDGYYRQRVCNASWKHHRWLNGFPVGDKDWGPGDRDGPFCQSPTHWMDLPLPPEGEQ